MNQSITPLEGGDFKVSTATGEPAPIHNFMLVGEVGLDSTFIAHNTNMGEEYRQKQSILTTLEVNLIIEALQDPGRPSTLFELAKWLHARAENLAASMIN